MYKIIIACMMLVSLKASRVLEKQEVSCKVSITQDEAKKDQPEQSNFKVSINCEDLTTKSKQSQNLVCKTGEKFTVFKVNKAAVQANNDKQVKTDNGQTQEPTTNNQSTGLADNNQPQVDPNSSKVQVDNEQVTTNTSQNQVQNLNEQRDAQDVELQNQLEKNKQSGIKRRILAEKLPQEMVNTYELTVAEQQFNIENYSLQGIDKLEGCSVLVKGSLINSMLKIASVLVLALF